MPHTHNDVTPPPSSHPPPAPSALTRQSRETATDPRSEADRTPQSAPQPAARGITHNKHPLWPTTPVFRPPVEVGGAGEPSYLEDLHMGGDEHAG